MTSRAILNEHHNRSVPPSRKTGWSSTYLLSAVPPGWIPKRFEGNPLPLGAALVLDLSGGPAAIGAMISEHCRMPWCPLCVIVPAHSPASPTALEALQGLPTRASFIGSEGNFPKEGASRLRFEPCRHHLRLTLWGTSCGEPSVSQRRMYWRSRWRLDLAQPVRREVR